MRLVIITGNSLRHMYLVQEVEKHLDVVKVVAEEKFDYKKAFESSEFSETVNQHFNLRSEKESKYFEKAAPDSQIIHLKKGEVNSMEWVEELKSLEVDGILLFGSSIIKEPLLKAYENRVINLHLGLSPYYRGSGTNFWPVVDHRPECVGATIHLAVPKVDAGPILHQVRPGEVSESDTIHDLGNKTIKAAAAAIPEVIRQYLNGTLNPIKQDGGGDEAYKRMDLNGKSIEEVYSYMASEDFKDYVNNRRSREKLYPIIEQL